MDGAANGTSRRGFLGRAAGAAVAVAGAGVGAGAITGSAAAADKRSYTAGHFALELGGLPCGKFGGLDGGQRELAVALDPVGPDNIQRKHVANIKWNDFTMQVGSSMSKPFYDWIQASFDKGSSVRKSGAVIACDFNYKEKSRRRISNAFITEVTIPALDGASKDPGYIAVSVKPERITVLPTIQTPVGGAKQKAWLCSNFVFEIGGLDTSRVAKIDSFTWKCGIAPDGSDLLEVSDMRVSFPKADLSSWQEWYRSLASGADDERDGALTLIGAQQGSVVTLGLYNMGLYRLSPDPVSPTKRFNAELYVETMKWDLKKGDRA